MQKKKRKNNMFTMRPLWGMHHNCSVQLGERKGGPLADWELTGSTAEPTREFCSASQR